MNTKVKKNEIVGSTHCPDKKWTPPPKQITNLRKTCKIRSKFWTCELEDNQQEQ